MNKKQLIAYVNNNDGLLILDNKDVKFTFTSINGKTEQFFIKAINTIMEIVYVSNEAGVKRELSLNDLTDHECSLILNKI